jgi:hypothetical protein
VAANNIDVWPLADVTGTGTCACCANFVPGTCNCCNEFCKMMSTFQFQLPAGITSGIYPNGLGQCTGVTTTWVWTLCIDVNNNPYTGMCSCSCTYELVYQCDNNPGVWLPVLAPVTLPSCTPSLNNPDGDWNMLQGNWGASDPAQYLLADANPGSGSSSADNQNFCQNGGLFYKYDPNNQAPDWPTEIAVVPTGSLLTCNDCAPTNQGGMMVTAPRRPLSLYRPDRCVHLEQRMEFRTGCNGMGCLHRCSKLYPAVPAGFCQRCPAYEPEGEGVPWLP